MKSHRGGATLALSDSVWSVVLTADLIELDEKRFGRKMKITESPIST
jgi:hypothetical protein